MKSYKVNCPNCKTSYNLTVGILKEKEFDSGVIATYVECPVCGENTLKQLDNESTQDLVKKATKYSLLKMKNKKLTSAQKDALRRLNSQLIIQRKKLNQEYWADIHQQLNS